MSLLRSSKKSSGRTTCLLRRTNPVNKEWALKAAISSFTNSIVRALSTVSSDTCWGCLRRKTKAMRKASYRFIGSQSAKPWVISSSVMRSCGIQRSQHGCSSICSKFSMIITSISLSLSAARTWGKKSTQLFPDTSWMLLSIRCFYRPSPKDFKKIYQEAMNFSSSTSSISSASFKTNWLLLSASGHV